MNLAKYNIANFIVENLNKLIVLFRELGGVVKNVSIEYKEEYGYFCSVIDHNRKASVFCPSHLLVDVNDIGINDTGLYIKNPKKYKNSIKFLEKYFSFHFNKSLVEKFIEEKHQINSLSNIERQLLAKINLPDVVEGLESELEYVKYRIFQSYQITSESSKKVIMPFVSYLNHDRDGTAFKVNKKGISVSAQPNNELLAHYHMGDVLMFLRSYGFVTDTMFIYSLPMLLQLPNGLTLKVDRDISKFKLIDGKVRWPIVEKNNNIINISWLPLFYKNDPLYPVKIVGSLSRDFNVPAEFIMYSAFLFNLNTLLPIVFSLRESDNSYLKTVVSGVEKQLSLMGCV